MRGAMKARWHVLFAVGAFFLFPLVSPSLSKAADNYWKGDLSDYDWSIDSLWSLGSDPKDGADVYLTYPNPYNLSPNEDRNVVYIPTDPDNKLELKSLSINSGFNYTMTLAQGYDGLSHYLGSEYEYVGTTGTGSHVHSRGTNRIQQDLVVGQSDGGTGSYSLAGSGTLTVNGLEYIGYGGTGSFTQSGGVHAIPQDSSAFDNLYLGYQATGVGSYSLHNGTLTVGDSTYVGYEGNGSITQYGGTNTIIANLILGQNSSGRGTYSLHGGSLSAQNELIGNSGIGQVIHDGGKNTVAAVLSVGHSSGGDGTYALSGSGSLSANHEFIGREGRGSFTQTGGTNTIANHLFTGYYATGVGTFTLSGGNLSVGGDEYIGHGGTGTFIHNATLNSVNRLFLGVLATGDGTYSLNPSGNLTLTQHEVVGLGGKGTFMQNGGSHSVQNGQNLYVGFGSTGHGTFILGGGSLSVSGDEYIGHEGTGTFIHDAAVNPANNLHLGYSATGDGTYTLNHSGNLTVSEHEYVGYRGKGTFTQIGGLHSIQNGNNLYVGFDSTAQGSFTLGGGSLSASGDEYIGYGGTGTFTHNLTTHTANNLYLGYLSTGDGAYTLNADGQLNVNQHEYVGYGGKGTFTQNGGYHDIQYGKNLFVGYNSTGQGLYTLCLGGNLLLRGGDESIGYSGTGTFNQIFGQHSIQGGKNLYVGQNSTGQGNFLLRAGSLSVSGDEYVGYEGTGTVSQDGGVNTARNLYLGYMSSGEGAYVLDWAGALTVNQNEYIGYKAKGSFTQQGGTHKILGSNLYIGYEDTGRGTFSLEGGSLSVSGDQYVGYEGTGTFDHVVSANPANSLYVGYKSSGDGTYTLWELGKLTVSQHEYIGYEGKGQFTQNSGTHTISNHLYVGGYESDIAGTGNGTFTLAGGSLSVVGNEYIGYTGTGTFIQNGAVNPANTLYLGYMSGGDGSYVLNEPGALTVSQHEYIGYRGTGSFTQNGGTHTLFNDLYLGKESKINLEEGYQYEGRGFYALTGGTLNVLGDEYIGYRGTGSFTQNGGTHLVRTSAKALYIGYESIWDLGNECDRKGVGSYTLSGGNLSAREEYIGFKGTGEFIHTGGTHSVDRLYLGKESIDEHYYDYNDFSAVGSYALSGTGLLSVTEGAIVGYRGTGNFVQDGGSHIARQLYLGYEEELVNGDVYGRGDGFYTLNGGHLSVTDESHEAQEYIGFKGSGSFTQAGGTHTVDDLRLGQGSSGSGSYSMNGGNLDAYVETIGWYGTGMFTQDGGIHAVHTVSIGHESDEMLGVGYGSYALSGSGLLSVSAVEYLGNEGIGTFTQTGGTHSVAQGLYIGHGPSGSGSYTLSLGSLTVNNENGDANEYIGYHGTGAFNQNGGTHDVDRLYVGYESFSDGPGVGSYTMNDGNLTAGDEHIGFKSTGTFLQNGGSHTVDRLYVGYESLSEGPGVGSYTMVYGNLNSDQEYIGFKGTGTFSQSGGMHVVGNLGGEGGTEPTDPPGGGTQYPTFLYLGYDTNSSGSYTLSGFGKLFVSQWDNDASEYIGYRGTGTFVQEGGTHSVENLVFGQESSGSGSYTLSGFGVLGLLSVGYESPGDEIIGNRGTGSFIQNGGKHLVARRLYLGHDSGGSGTYTLNNGALLLMGEWEEDHSEYIGYEGAGTFSQHGGGHAANSIQIGNVAGSGTYTMTGGNLEVFEDLSVGSRGEMFLSGGSVKANTLKIAEALAFDFTGGVLQVFNVEGNLTNKGGTLAPGASPGLLTIEGDYEQWVDAILQIELGGLTRGDKYDALDVTGNLSLAGTLDVRWYGDFDASDIDSGALFDIFNWGGVIDGAFDQIILPDLLDPLLVWNTSNLYADGTIFVARAQEPVPEPATMLLLGSGLIGLAAFRRKRVKRG